MTLETPRSAGTEPQRVMSRFVRYVFFKVDSDFKKLPEKESQTVRADFLSTMKRHERELSVRTYSLVGTRADVDFMLWTTSDSLDKFQDFQSGIEKTSMGRFLETPYSYLAMFRPSEYFGKARDPEPIGSKYLFVYPLTKKREWYSLPFEERQRIMKDHVQTGHKYSSVAIHTAYSFGLDDYEFVLSFETDHPEDFLNLVMDLRTTESSKYTAVETPIFTCISMSPEKMLGLLVP